MVRGLWRTRILISRVEARGMSWPDALMDNFDAAKVVSGGDRDKEPSMRERLLSLSGALLFG